MVLVLYAMRLTDAGVAQAMRSMTNRGVECPLTGWVHASKPPWRVLVTSNPGDMSAGPIYDVVEYTGTEPVISLENWLREGRKS